MCQARKSLLTPSSPTDKLCVFVMYWARLCKPVMSLMYQMNTKQLCRQWVIEYSYNTLIVSRIIYLMLTCTITRPGLKLGSLFLISSTCPGGWKNPGKQVSPFSWDRSELLGPRLSLRALLQPSLLYLKQYSLNTDNRSNFWSPKTKVWHHKLQH